MKFYSKEELCDVFGFYPATKADFLRLDIAYENYKREYEAGNDGAFGRVAEPLTRRPNSRKANVAKQNRNDITAKIDGKLVPCERKTNGGRIRGTEYDMTGTYVVYSMNVHNSTCDADISARICRKSTFLEKLVEFNAIKEVRHNGVVDGLAIQPSNKRFRAWLETLIEYERECEYSSEEIEQGEFSPLPSVGKSPTLKSMSETEDITMKRNNILLVVVDELGEEAVKGFRIPEAETLTRLEVEAFKSALLTRVYISEEIQGYYWEELFECRDDIEEKERQFGKAYDRYLDKYEDEDEAMSAAMYDIYGYSL